MKTLVTIEGSKVEAPEESTPKLPKLVHLEGWRSDGLLPHQAPYNQRREGGQQCNR